MPRPRKEYNFSKDVKLKALRSTDFCCAVSGLHKRETLEGYLEIHHQIAICFYLAYKEWFNSIGIDDDFIRSVNNALPLSVAEHRKIHEQESLEYYKSIAIALLGLVQAGY